MGTFNLTEGFLGSILTLEEQNALLSKHLQGSEMTSGPVLGSNPFT